MHPAPSVIVFTTLSGAGFGLLFWLGLGVPDVRGLSAFAFFVIAYLLAAGGLMASTLHLGRPERALKAFTQWRTSWLSREAWLSVAALLAMAAYGAGLVFVDTRVPWLGWLGAALAAATVLATSMIYTQIAAVPRWHTALTPALFLALSAGGGALLAGQVTAALALLALAAVVQIAWWLRGDGALARSRTDMSSATGLPGRVRAFEPPHTGPNYLLREMVFRVGRKHALKLRGIALVLGYLAPIVLLLVPFAHWLAAVAVLAHLAGIAVSRWLFFAEAEHVVGLYYGMR